MAIDNYIDKITKDGESRMISPAADKVRVENEHYEGDNLDDVLDEIDEKVSQAGTGNYTKPSTGIPKSDMESAVQTSLGKADSAVQGIQINGGLILPKVHNNVDIFIPTKTSQLQNDSGFITASQVPSGEADSAMSDTSENVVQNRVIKAYVDGLIQGLRNVLNTITQDGATQGVIDTFNEVKAFLEGISSSDTLAAKLATLVPNTRTINGKSLSSNVTIGINDIDGLAAAIAAAGSGAVSVSIPDPADGTFTIHVGDDSYTINLNHTHEGMAKLVVCEESGLPSAYDDDTIYAVTDNGEIGKLIIRGMEFAGGGIPDTGEPMIISPSNGSTINLGTNDGSGVSKTITVKGKNLTGDLTVTVGTGLTISYGQSTGQSSVTIPMAQALLGTQVSVSYGGSGALDDGSLVISHGGSVLSSVVVVEAQPIAVKFTGSQWVETGVDIGPNTAMKLDMRILNDYGSQRDHYHILSVSNSGFALNTGTVTEATILFFWIQGVKIEHDYGSGLFTRGVVDYTNGSVSFLGQTFTAATKTSVSTNLAIGKKNDGTAFNFYYLEVYGLEIYESGVLTHHFVPKVVNGVAGLYDTETGNFVSSGTSTPLVAIYAQNNS